MTLALAGAELMPHAAPSPSFRAILSGVVRQSRLVAVLIAGVACGSSPSPPPAVTTPAPEKSDARSTPSSALHAEDTDVETGRADEPPVAAQLVPVPRPFAADAVVTLPAADPAPVTLFEDERTTIRRTMADFVAATGRPVVPIDELLRIEVAARRGQLVLEDNVQCRAPLSMDEVVERYYDVGPHAQPRLNCEDGCRLELAIGAWGAAPGRRFRSSVFADGHRIQAWKNARLLPRTDNQDGRSKRVPLITRAHPPPIALGRVHATGPWTVAPTSDEIAAQARQLRQCAAADPHAAVRYRILLAVAASGRVTRCAADVVSSSAATTASPSCVCDALRETTFRRGRAGRRVRLQARDRSAFVSGRSAVEVVQGGTESWIARITAAGVVRRCLAEHPPSADITVTAALELDRDGAVAEVKVFGPIVDPPTMAWARCLIDHLDDVPLPCRPPGIDVLHVRFVADVG